jgi:hypothetical protein
MTSTEDFRSFRVEAFVGHRASGWPFARFKVGPHALQVKLSFPWFSSRAAAKPTVSTVSVHSSNISRRACLRFDAPAGSLADVHVHVPFRPDRIIDELRRCGYEVADERPVRQRRLGVGILRPKS